jgi:CheY-like chemotaxis protein
MDGYQATIAIRAFKNANNLVPVPIIAVTANVCEADDRQG